MRLVHKLLPLLIVPFTAATLVAQSAPVAPTIAQLQQQIADAKGSADNAWMLVCSALVLLMTGPGLALFYGGLVRKKNVLGTMMQSFAMMALITVVWAIIGYSLCFASGNSFIGGLEHAFLHGVGAVPDADYAATIPQQTFMIYQLMFAIITPALICGAFAERMKFSAMLLFMAMWSLLVYAPMAHMVWGKGGLLNASLGGRFPTLDFAGGTVVHITSGVSALVCALYLGRRVGFPKEADAAPQCGTQLYRRLPALGGLVWIQCRKRSQRGQSGHQRICRDALRGGHRGDWMGGSGVDSQRQAQRAGSDLRLGRRPGGDHACRRIRRADVGFADRLHRRRFLLCHGRRRESETRLRRLARCLRRARRRGNHRRVADRRLRHQRH